MGLYFFIGFKASLKFFIKKGSSSPTQVPPPHPGKIKGSLCFFSGFALIVLNWGFIGALLQVSGFVLIFRTFLPDLYDYICKVPVVGNYLSTSPPKQKATGCKARSTRWPATRSIGFDCQ